ncbi:MAG: PD-(D/E)XK nuclease family protein [Candidatus Bilamarchaeaceae archaeon]
MRLTNRFDIPSEVVEAILCDSYSHRGDISVTSLLLPPRIRVLRKRHWDDIEEDVADRLWSLYGRIIHGLLERTNDWQAFHEERLSVEVNGWTLTGQADLYKRKSTGEHVLRDYKFVSVYTANEPRTEWVSQVNIYAWMWRQTGFPVDRAQLVLLFRDWRRREFERSQNGYPPPVKIIDVPLWDDDFTADYVKWLVNHHQIAETLSDEKLPLCTPEDRWERGKGWAVMREGRKKAIRLCPTEDEALQAAAKLGADHYVVERPGEQVRCLYFCNVKPFCDFGANLEAQRDDGLG